MFFEEDDYRNQDQEFGRSIVPLHVPLDRSTVVEALAHLRMQPWKSRKRWHRQLEAVLHRFARSIGYWRRPINVGLNRTQIWWMPRESGHTGFPETDVDFLRDQRLLTFPSFLELEGEISNIAGLAELVVTALIVRRDNSLRDYVSVHKARSVFDAYRWDFVRTMYEQIETRGRLKKQLQTAVVKCRDAANRRKSPIKAELVRLQAAKTPKTPRRQWCKLTLKALAASGEFNGKSDAAVTRQIQRVMRTEFPPPTEIVPHEQ